MATWQVSGKMARWQPVERSQTHCWWNDLGFKNWSFLEGFARKIWSVESSLWTFPTVFSARTVAKNYLWTSDGLWSQRQHWMGTLQYWWEFNSYSQVCSRCPKKSLFSEEPENHTLGRSCGGFFGTKVHVVCDGKGLALEFELTPGQAHESQHFKTVVETIEIRSGRGRPWKRPENIAGDKGHSCNRIREWVKSKKIGDVIPIRSRKLTSTKSFIVREFLLKGALVDWRNLGELPPGTKNWQFTTPECLGWQWFWSIYDLPDTP